MKMLQMLKWKYNSDPRGIQYKEVLSDYHLLHETKRNKKELKQILLFLAHLYKKKIKESSSLKPIFFEIDQYYKYLSETEKMEYQKLIEKVEI